MPKRKFEMIPDVSFLPDARSARAFVRTQREWIQYWNPNITLFHDNALLNAAYLNSIRRFGLGSDVDRQYFATMTGRSNHIMRSLRTMVDRRRRQAYLLLRRVLPVEVSQRILMMNSNSRVTNLLVRLGPRTYWNTPHNWHN